MAEENPELRSALHELERELEEGDITEKGYQKRRTLILSQFFGPNDGQQSSRGLSTGSPDSAARQAADRSSRVPSFATGTANSRSLSGSFSFVGGRSESPILGAPQANDNVTRESVHEMDPRYGPPDQDYPVNQVNRFQERELGYNPVQRSASVASYDSLFLPKTGGGGGHPQEPIDDGGSMMDNQNYAYNPPTHEYMDHGNPYGPPTTGPTRQSTMLDSQQGFFSDFAGQQSEEQRDSYGGFHRYSQSDTFSPSMNVAPPLIPASELPQGAIINHQLPLEPRDIPFAIQDPHNSNVSMSTFDNIPTVLRHRARTHGKQPAYWVLDQKGKEIASITWEKLASRAEKVAQVIRDKSSLYRGDRVALIYRDAEIIEFAVALMGCFIAGVVAVPINNLEDYASLNVILTSTQAHLALTTENNLKTFQRDITTQKLNWPRGVEWWKTNEFGSYHPKKKDDTPPLVVPDLAYIEFSRAPTGDLRGVVMSHRTIMHQMACLSAIISTASTEHNKAREKQGRVITSGSHGEIIMSYLDPRQSIGMILGVLYTVYGGHTTVWLEQRAVETPGLYANLITKYRTSLMVADYPGLKHAAYNYQQDPMTTRNFKKNVEPNFSSVKLCLIDTLTVDPEFHELLADRWLRPMRNQRARELVAPMLCLPEHGGMVISMRDQLGGEERMGCSLTHEMNTEKTTEETKDEKSGETKGGFGSSLIGGPSAPAPKKHARTEMGEALLDKEALKNNEVVVLAMGEDAKRQAGSMPHAVRVGAFGYPIPDATLSIVDPETSLLCTPNVIGEIWVDSPSLSGGFWALPKHTETIFHARPYRFHEGNPTPTVVEPEFLRTGLLGCVIEGKIFVLGLYEDRLRQKVEWVEHGLEVTEHRYFFVQHLIISIMKNVPKIHDCSAFDVFVNDEHLPVVLLESYAASTAPTTSGGPPRQLDTAVLDTLTEKCMEVLYQEHHVRVYCIMITAPNTLPRLLKNGRPEIGNMLCRKEFDNGSLPCVHVKFGVERSVLNLPVGIDPVGGIWSPNSAAAREEILSPHETQYSGVDYRDVVIDDRSSTPLNDFSSIVDLLQWRVSRQAEELSYCSIDGRGKEGKGITWKKFDTKVAAVATYLRNKVKVRPGDHLILMYTHSEEFVFAIHACFCLGVIALPMAPVDQNRLSEDAPAFLHMVSDFRVKAIIVNNHVDHLLKQKIVSQHIKQAAQVLRVGVPAVYNTTKPSKSSHGCRHLGFTMNPLWIKNNQPAMIWTYWTPDQRRISVQIGHDTIMGMCKVQKETCQMTSSRPVLGSVRSTMGLGFLHTCLMGCYVGAPTYLVSPVDYATNPLSLFLTLARYKIKDTYATSQMLDYAMSAMAGKGFQLHELKNLMIAADGRPRVDVYQKVRLHFAGAGLDRTSINTIYSHVLNPMIASRSYMCIDPVELWLDIKALRRGLIYPVDPDTDPGCLLVQDSGMVPVSTQIAIVNPESCYLSRVGEYGEIWVQSEGCAKAFYGSKQDLDLERVNGRTMDGDPNLVYVRTGDLGFLHTVTRPIGPGGQPVEMQVLFVLGSVGDTFEVNGLSHFPMDIEQSVEKCHRNIIRGGCAVFQAGGLVVVVVEVTRKAYLASVVPVIVNAILNEHQVVVDIVAFVSQGDFLRSRLGEKQRGKILGAWITRKLRTIAQFSIRELGAEPQITEVPGPRNRGSKAGSALSAGGEPSNLQIQSEASSTHQQSGPGYSDQDVVPVSNTAESAQDGNSTMWNDTEDEAEYKNMLTTGDDNNYAPAPHDNHPAPPPALSIANPSDLPDPQSPNNNDTPTAITPDHGFDFGDNFSRDNSNPVSPRDSNAPQTIPSVDVIPPPTSNSQSDNNNSPSTSAPPIIPPLVVGRGRDSLPSQQLRYSSIPTGALQVANMTSPPEDEEEAPGPSGKNSARTSGTSTNVEDWPQEALLYQSLGVGDNNGGDGQGGSGDLSRTPTSKSAIVRKRYDGSDYDHF